MQKTKKLVTNSSRFIVKVLFIFVLFYFVITAGFVVDKETVVLWAFLIPFYRYSTENKSFPFHFLLLLLLVGSVKDYYRLN